MKRVLLFILFLKSPAYAVGVLSDIIQPLIANCPQFSSGQAQIRLLPAGYAVWEGGRHNYHFQCYIPGSKDPQSMQPLADTVLVEGVTKTGDAKNSPVVKNDPTGDECPYQGSIILMDSRSLGESIPLVGVPFDLMYFSHRAMGRYAESALTVPLDGGNPLVSEMRVEGSYADGQTFSATYPNLPGQSLYFRWNNKGLQGQPIQGSVDLDFKVIYKIMGKDIPVHYSKKIGGWKAAYMHLGGWQPSIYHYYDFARGLLNRGYAKFEKIAPLQKGAEYWVVADQAREIFVFNSQGTHLRTLFGLTGKTKFVFNHDVNGLLASVTDENNQTTLFNRDPMTKNVISIVAPFGQLTQLQYSLSGFLLSVTDPLHRTYRMTYKGLTGLLESFQKPEGAISYFTYDQDGLLIKDQHSGGFSANLWQETDNTWYSIKRVVSQSALGRQSKREMQNALGTVGESHSFMYYPNGTVEYNRKSVQVDSQRDELGNLVGTSYRSDVRFSNSRYIARSSQTLQGKYSGTDTLQTVQLAQPNDPFSIVQLLFTTTDGLYQRTSHYNGNGKSWTHTSAEGAVRVQNIDDNEKTVLVKNGNYLPTYFTYNNFGKLKQIQQGDRKTVFEYDQYGYLSQAIDALGRIKKYDYDVAGNLMVETLFDGRQVKYQYDKNSRLTQIVPPHGQVHQFNYNALELLNQYIAPSVDSVSNSNRTIYQYNFDKQITQITLPDGRQKNFYYKANDIRLSSISTSEQTTSYYYEKLPLDQASRIVNSQAAQDITISRDYLSTNYLSREQVTVNESGYTTASELSFTYDEKHRLEQMSIQDNTGAKWALARYQYNGDNQPTYVNQLRLTYKKNSGQLESKEINKIKIVYSYDNQYGDLSKIDYQVSGKSVYVQEFKRNLIGQISEVNRGEAIQLHYDKVGRYIGKTKKNSPIDLASHIYDKNGNRVKGEEDGQSYVASYDVQDRLISYNGSTYSYGASGELQSVVSPSLELTTYSYNTDGRLIGVSRAGKQVSYKLDGEGRRIEKKVNGVSSRYYVWDGSLRLVGEMNSVGELLSRYIYVGGEHSPTMMEKGSERYIFIKDERGSIEKVVNIKSGEVVEEISYGDWGNIKSDSNADFQPFRYAGGLYDSDTGLIRFGVRDYDPTIGRWTSKDPIGFAGGDTNFYGYVANDPINFIDPMGLWRWPGDIYDDAKRGAEQSRLPGPHNGLQDGYRHCLASCMMTQENGNFLSQLLGDLNEKRGDWTHNQQSGEKCMDQANNKTGRDFGKGGGNCAQQCMGAATGGGLTTYPSGTTPGYWY